MTSLCSHAISSPNIALIKYWGNQDNALRIPANNSISFNLSELTTHTQVEFDAQLERDELVLNEALAEGYVLQRMCDFLDIVRQMANRLIFARVTSTNNFPTSAGIASSASAFSALALAATSALGLRLTERQLSRLARRGSGSASRSIPDGFVEWFAGSNDENSYAVSIAPPTHWNIADCVALIETQRKNVGSSEGQHLAFTSPLQKARIQDAPRRLGLCRQAIQNCDFEKLASVTELDSNMMHAIMMTSTPSLFYWHPQSLEILRRIPLWRSAGLPVCYTLDAGPNVHVICPAEYEQQTASKLKEITGVQNVLITHPGIGTRLVNQEH